MEIAFYLLAVGLVSALIGKIIQYYKSIYVYININTIVI